MTDLRQAAQQALDALESLQGGCTDSDDGTVEALTVWCPEVIDTLRKALEQQAEPVATFQDGVLEGQLREREYWVKQQAEPVAYFDFQEFKFTWAKHMKIGPVPVSIKVEPLKLYSEAAQRQWVGLTDEDWAKVADMPDTFDQGVAWAAARLKEKNNT